MGLRQKTEVDNPPCTKKRNLVWVTKTKYEIHWEIGYFEQKIALNHFEEILVFLRKNSIMIFWLRRQLQKIFMNILKILALLILRRPKLVMNLIPSASKEIPWDQKPNLLEIKKNLREIEIPQTLKRWLENNYFPDNNLVKF